MEDIKLSIIVPVYNMEKYIERCLSSIVALSLSQIEVIIVDDGSTDESARIAYGYVYTDSRFSLYRKENGGLISARKYGLHYAKGEYITFIDSDDWIERNAYTDVIGIIDKYHPDMIAYPFYKDYIGNTVVRNDKLKSGLYSRKELDCEIKNLDEYPFFTQLVNDSLCTKVIKKTFIKDYYEVIPTDITIGEDTAIVIPALLNLESLYVSDKVYYHYVQNQQSQCWNHNKGAFSKLKMLEKHLKQYLSDEHSERNQYIINAIFFSYMMILYDWPKENFISGIPFFPKIDKKSKIVIYGKGVFASNLIVVIQKMQLAEIVMNIDSNDSKTLFEYPVNQYDYVLICVLDALIVEKIKMYLLDNGIEENKIMIIDKTCLTMQNLP